jgi:hypothetical protein
LEEGDIFVYANQRFITDRQVVADRIIVMFRFTVARTNQCKQIARTGESACRRQYRAAYPVHYRRWRHEKVFRQYD